MSACKIALMTTTNAWRLGNAPPMQRKKKKKEQEERGDREISKEGLERTAKSSNANSLTHKF